MVPDPVAVPPNEADQANDLLVVPAFNSARVNACLHMWATLMVNAPEAGTVIRYTTPAIVSRCSPAPVSVKYMLSLTYCVPEGPVIAAMSLYVLFVNVVDRYNFFQHIITDLVLYVRYRLVDCLRKHVGTSACTVLLRTFPRDLACDKIRKTS